jgi:D-alanyl-D-alanine carboxypeptidase (penicillin-binding protein 5/6)
MARARVRAGVAIAAVLAPVLLLATTAGGQLGTPPPTPVPPRGSPSPFRTELATPADPVPPPAVDAPVVLLADLTNDQILQARAIDARRPVASLTKVMTALLTLERTQPGDIVTVPPEAVFAPDEYGASSTLGLRAGERLPVRDLLEAIILQSSNDAAIALAVHVAGSTERFVELMNRRAVQLGMRDTRFASPNGLDDRGLSTASDLLVLLRAAQAQPGFRELAATRFAEIPSPKGPPRRVQNRNVLLWLYPGATGVKTGSTVGARFCLIATAKRDGRELAVILLGDPDETFSDAAALLNHGFAGFERHPFVARGDDLGVVRIVGGAVPVVAGADLEALVATGLLDRAQRRIVVDPRAAYPPAVGERVGTMRVTLPGVTVGSVPLLAAEVPPPPAAEGPWWIRAGRTVARAFGQAVAGLFG